MISPAFVRRQLSLVSEKRVSANEAIRIIGSRAIESPDQMVPISSALYPINQVPYDNMSIASPYISGLQDNESLLGRLLQKYVSLPLDYKMLEEKKEELVEEIYLELFGDSPGFYPVYGIDCRPNGEYNTIVTLEKFLRGGVAVCNNNSNIILTMFGSVIVTYPNQPEHCIPTRSGLSTKEFPVVFQTMSVGSTAETSREILSVRVKASKLNEIRGALLFNKVTPLDLSEIELWVDSSINIPSYVGYDDGTIKYLIDRFAVMGVPIKEVPISRVDKELITPTAEEALEALLEI